MTADEFRKLADVKPTRTMNLKPREIPESEVVKMVMRHFYFDPNVRLFRRNVGAIQKDKRFIRFGHPGQSDIEGVIRVQTCPHCGKVTGRGVHLEIECKRCGGKLSENQRIYLETMRQMGAVTVVAIPYPNKQDPTGFRAIREALDNVIHKMCPSCSERLNGNQPVKA